MAITILTARAHRLFPAVVEALGERVRRGETSLMLVPEQFTLAAERELMTRLHLTGMFLIDVMSPSRFSEHVLAGAEPGAGAAGGQASLLRQHRAAPRVCGEALRADYRHEARRPGP